MQSHMNVHVCVLCVGPNPSIHRVATCPLLLSECRLAPRRRWNNSPATVPLVHLVNKAFDRIDVTYVGLFCTPPNHHSHEDHYIKSSSYRRLTPVLGMSLRTLGVLKKTQVDDETDETALHTKTGTRHLEVMYMSFKPEYQWIE